MNARQYERSQILPSLATLPYHPIVVPKTWYQRGDKPQTKSKRDDKKLLQYVIATRVLPTFVLLAIDDAIERVADRMGIADTEARDYARDRLTIQVARVNLPEPTGPILRVWARFRLLDAIRHFKSLKAIQEKAVQEYLVVYQAMVDETARKIEMIARRDRLLTLTSLPDDSRLAAILRLCPLTQQEQGLLLGVTRWTIIRWNNEDEPQIAKVERMLPTLPMWTIVDLFVNDGMLPQQIAVELNRPLLYVRFQLKLAKLLISVIMNGGKQS